MSCEFELAQSVVVNINETLYFFISPENSR